MHLEDVMKVISNVEDPFDSPTYNITESRNRASRQRFHVIFGLMKTVSSMLREEIVIWVRKKIGVPVIRISSVDEAAKYLTKLSVFVIGMFEKFEGSDCEEFVKAAKSNNEMQFVETDSKEVAKLMFPSLKPCNVFLGLVKSEPEKYTAYGISLLG